MGVVFKGTKENTGCFDHYDFSDNATYFTTVPFNSVKSVDGRVVNGILECYSVYYEGKSKKIEELFFDIVDTKEESIKDTYISQFYHNRAYFASTFTGQATTKVIKDNGNSADLL